ncbi:MAG: calcium-binding EGF-like domain-containing protein [Flavipsychrobacter sp.]|nr:calcium-binding EGF-like domain-containing protein [Flavipsychrobacter sp.]
MKSIRRIALAAAVTLSAFGAVTFTSCNPDECKDVVCANGGSCNSDDGSCTCATGYEGATCETKMNAKFVGTWSAAENCSGSTATYQVVITADGSDPTKVLVSNLGNYGCTVGGTVTFDGTVNGATLTINDSECTYQMNATGTYNSNGSVSFTYTATYPPANTDNCTATLTK